MTDSERRFKIEKIEEYQEEKKEDNKKALKSFGLGVFSLFLINMGLKAILEAGNIPANIDVTNIKIIIWSIFGLGASFEIKSICSFLSSLKNKLNLDGRIQEIQEDITLYDEQIRNKSRGGR